MTKEELAHRALEAQRLLSEPLLADAIEATMMEALVALGEVDPTNTNEIYRLQAVVSCTRSIVTTLQSHIAAGGSMDGGLADETPE